MIQQLIVYAVVAVAVGWTAWTLVLRGWLKRRAAARSAAGAAANCSSDCACGD
jgi:hypothetical protein